MKARKVRGLDAHGRLDENARRIIAVRADEVLDLAGGAQDPSEVRALHDLRIALKRLRYVLELTGSVALGETAAAQARRVKGLQDLLGDIHDCDVQLPELRALARELPEAQAAGMRALAVRFAVRRAELYEHFHAQWPAHAQAFTSLSRGDAPVALEVQS